MYTEYEPFKIENLYNHFAQINQIINMRCDFINKIWTYQIMTKKMSQNTLKIATLERIIGKTKFLR